MSEQVAVRVVVYGRVQGVFFRAFVGQRGRELGLTGYVRNLSRGDAVEIVAEGERARLEKRATEAAGNEFRRLARDAQHARRDDTHPPPAAPASRRWAAEAARARARKQTWQKKGWAMFLAALPVLLDWGRKALGL